MRSNAPPSFELQQHNVLDAPAALTFEQPLFVQVPPSGPRDTTCCPKTKSVEKKPPTIHHPEGDASLVTPVAFGSKVSDQPRTAQL
ncbi:unnamed protein product [Rotaria magnacalcarata]